MNEQTAHTIGAAIVSHLTIDGGLVATYEYPGAIVVPHAGGTADWWFGTVNNDRWEGQLQTRDGGHVVETRYTDVPADCADASRIALAIARVLLTDRVRPCTDSYACARRGCADCQRSYGPRRAR
jgi:hypothetical protein